MPATENTSHRWEPIDLADPEFRPIKARLVRAYLHHKVDLGVYGDQEIVDHVDDITAILVGLVRRAMREGDEAWLARFKPARRGSPRGWGSTEARRPPFISAPRS